MARKILVLVLLFLVVASLAAGIYKWVDEKGVTHYSDAPPSTRKARELDIPSTPRDGAQSQGPAAKSWQEQELEFRQRHAARLEAERRQEQQDALNKRLALARKQRCIIAQQNLHVLQMQRAVYSLNEKGERVFLDDETRASEIARMKKEIETFCDPQ